MQKIFELAKRHGHILRFLVVGGLSFAIDYGLLLASYHLLKLPLAIATTTGFLGGLAINFLLNKYWTFQVSHSAKQSLRQAVLYTLLVCVNLVLTNAIVLALSAIHIRPELSKPISTALITVINYVVYKWVIFKDTEPDIEAIEQGRV
jgi:putative flippase GtrA